MDVNFRRKTVTVRHALKENILCSSRIGQFLYRKAGGGFIGTNSQDLQYSMVSRIHEEGVQG